MIFRGFEKFAGGAMGKYTFLMLINWIFNFLKGNIVSHPIVEKFKISTLEKRLKFRGLEDESIFAWIFAKADFGPGGSGKKLLFREACNEIESEDRVKGTRNMKNFRMIVALDALGRGVVKSYDNEGNVVEAEYDLNYKQPGITILEGLASFCRTKEDWKASIMMVGAMQEAPFGNLNEFEVWAREKAWPAFKNAMAIFSSNISDFFLQLETYAAGAGILSEKRAEEYEKLPWWKRYLLNY